jgi:hypothetical protein
VADHQRPRPAQRADRQRQVAPHVREIVAVWFIRQAMPALVERDNPKLTRQQRRQQSPDSGVRG